jgi:hypothetical protein
VKRLKYFGLTGGVVSLLLVAGANTAAWANGGDFFAELSSKWGDPIAGTPFFGWVRDGRGKALAGVEVTAISPPDPSFSYREEVTVISDKLGHFQIQGFGLGVNAKDVVIDCAKAGYRVIMRDRRVLRSRPDAPVEVDFKIDNTNP